MTVPRRPTIVAIDAIVASAQRHFEHVRLFHRLLHFLDLLLAIERGVPDDRIAVETGAQHVRERAALLGAEIRRALDVERVDLLAHLAEERGGRLLPLRAHEREEPLQREGDGHDGEHDQQRHEGTALLDVLRQEIVDDDRDPQRDHRDNGDE
jgi:hypothetical protein